MASLRGDVTVLSLNEQVRQASNRSVRERRPFEVLVRHFLDRLLTNEALGEDTATRVTQLAYAIALPGLLVAMFLFPAYHGIPPGPRAYWSQACDHLFYVMYALVVTGGVTVFEWELLFPEMVDVYVLTALPLRVGAQVMGRIVALVLFLGAVLVGTNLLGAIFFPAVADLKGMWWRHQWAHGCAVAVSGVFAASLLVALQGLLLCVLGARAFRRLAALLQAVCLAVLLMTLFLFPVLAHFLEALMRSGGWEVLWFPPFWFLGLYERLLWGGSALPVFRELAQRGCVVTFGAAVLAALSYPAAYARRRKQLIEGAGLATRSGASAAGSALLHRWIVRRPEARAVYHFVGLTIGRSQRLQLYLAMYGGVGLAMLISGVLLFRVTVGGVRLELSGWGLRAAVAVVAFWVVVGLRTALASPVGRSGRWVFAVTGGRPKRDQIRAAEVWVSNCSLGLTLSTAAVALALGGAAMHTPRVIAGVLVTAVATCVLLTDFFFRNADTIPFTSMRTSTTVELPLTFVRYFVVFPALVLEAVDCEVWMEDGWSHVVIAAGLLLAAHVAFLWLRDRRWNDLESRPDVTEEEFLEPGLGLCD